MSIIDVIDTIILLVIIFSVYRMLTSSKRNCNTGGAQPLTGAGPKPRPKLKPGQSLDGSDNSNSDIGGPGKDDDDVAWSD